MTIYNERHAKVCMHGEMGMQWLFPCNAESRGLHIQGAIWTGAHVQIMHAGAKWNGVRSCMHEMSLSI